jgi:hypothetical protein
MVDFPDDLVEEGIYFFELGAFEGSKVQMVSGVHAGVQGGILTSKICRYSVCIFCYMVGRVISGNSPGSL